MKIKAIKIDCINKTVTEIEVENTFTGKDGMYEALDCSTIEIATYLDNGDAVYVDETGLDNPAGFFDIGAHQPFAGHGLVVGDKKGRDISCKSTLAEIKKKVAFLTLLLMLFFCCTTYAQDKDKPIAPETTVSDMKSSFRITTTSDAMFKAILDRFEEKLTRYQVSYKTDRKGRYCEYMLYFKPEDKPEIVGTVAQK